MTEEQRMQQVTINNMIDNLVAKAKTEISAVTGIMMAEARKISPHTDVKIKLQTEVDGNVLKFTLKAVPL